MDVKPMGMEAQLCLLGMLAWGLAPVAFIWGPLSAPLDFVLFPFLFYLALWKMENKSEFTSLIPDMGLLTAFPQRSWVDSAKWSSK